jgi:hypothetical protein
MRTVLTATVLTATSRAGRVVAAHDLTGRGPGGGGEAADDAAQMDWL